MFGMLRVLTVKELLLVEAPSLFVSLVVAELFYKFHSFTLECGAFLITWCAVGAAFRAGAALCRTGRRS
jgi:hypothetical protein